MGSQVSQDKTDGGCCAVQYALKQQIPEPVHTGVLSTAVRLQVRYLSLSIGLRRDVLSLIIGFCSPAEIGRLCGVDRSIHEVCETDAVWEAMLAADFWQSPMSPQGRPHRSQSLGRKVLDGDRLKIRRQTLLPKFFRNQLVKRWQCELAFRRKQALQEKMDALQVEMDLKIQHCRKTWTSIIKRRRLLACFFWLLGLAFFLKLSRNFVFVPLATLWLLIVGIYKASYTLIELTLRFVAPVVLCDRLIFIGRKNADSGLSICSRLFLLGCSFIAGQLPIGRAWQLVTSALSVGLAGCCVFAVIGIVALLTIAFLASSAYFTLRRARSLTKEFSAVEQRDREEAAISESYQAEIRKCRIGLGLPPDEQRSNSNCSIL